MKKKNQKRLCPACKGSGKQYAVWYGAYTGKIDKCQMCYGTGKSNSVFIDFL